MRTFQSMLQMGPKDRDVPKLLLMDRDVPKLLLMDRDVPKLLLMD